MKNTKSLKMQKSILLFTILTLLPIFGMPFGSATDALAAGKEVGKPATKRTFKKKTVRKSKIRKLKKTSIESRSINPEPQIEDEFEGDTEERKNWFLSQRMYPFSEIPAERRRKAWLNRPKNAAEKAVEENSPETAALEAAATSWTAIGPVPTSSKFPNNWGVTSGRINAIAVSPSDSQLILIGAATGGIWRSTDGGNTFTATSDNQVDLAVGSIAFAPTNNQIVYAGMGDTDGGYLGTGVLKSTDGGQSWMRISNDTLPSPGRISKIEVDSTDPNRVYVAQYSGKLYSSGFWYSTDGGVNWRETIGGLPRDLVKHPTQPNTLYLSLSRVDSQTPSTGGVFKSIDRGLTWTRIYTSPFSTTSNIRIAVTPAAPQNLYVLVGYMTTQIDVTARVEVSADEGATWTNRGGAFDAAQMDQMCHIFVHPTDANTIFIGTRDIWRSQNGGATYTNITNNFTSANVFIPTQSKSHPDQHHFYISPTNPNLIYIANDGGLWRSNDGANSFQSLNASLSLTMFTGLAVHPTDASKTYGGTQDNGTQRRSNAQGGWDEFISGDGGQTVIDPIDPSIVYTTFIFRDIYRFYNNGDTRSNNIGSNTIFANDRTAFYPPFVGNKANSTLYFGTYRLYLSYNRGDTWAASSGTLDLTKGGSDTLSAIGVGRSNTNIIYTGSAQGKVMVSTNTGANWTDRTAGLPNRFIKSIIVSPTDSNVAYLTVSGFDSGHVFKTVNAGASWTDISGNLPNIPTNTLLIDPRTPTTLYVGTDIGVFRSLTGGTNWETFNSGMPPVIVSEIEAQDSGLIQAATYGRGAYELLSSNTSCPVSLSANEISVSTAASTGTIAITATAGCQWTAMSNSPSWITVTGGATGTGNGTVSYSVAANTGTQRTGTITIGGQTFTVNQAAAASSYSISGLINYGTTPSGQTAKFVSGVGLNAAGNPTVSATSSSSTGAYQLSGLGSGAYTVTPSKTGDVNSISSFDASLVARRAANLISLTPNQMIAADTSNNGTVSSFDASLIARTAAGIANTGIAGQWKFVPVSRPYSGLAADLTGENYEAILMGEVSGNWIPPTSTTSPSGLEFPTKDEQTKIDTEEESSYQFNPVDSVPAAATQPRSKSKSGNGQNQAAQATINVTLPANTSASNGTTVVIPVTVGDTTGAGIFSYDFTVTFDPNVLQPADPVFDTTGTVSGAAGFSITPNTSTSGQVTISAFGTQALSGAGTLIFLRFTVVGTAGTATGSTSLAFQSFVFNEGDPAAATTGGTFTVTGPTAASVGVGGRVMTTSGRGIRNVVITMIDSQGNTRTAATTSFGYYQFENVAAGQSYIFAARGKRFSFRENPQVRSITEDINHVNFIAKD